MQDSDSASARLCPCLPLLARSFSWLTSAWGGERERENFNGKGLHTAREDWPISARSQSFCGSGLCESSVCLPCSSQRFCGAAARTFWLSHGGQPRARVHVSHNLVSTRSVPDRRPPLACHCPRCRTADVLLQRHHSKGLLVNNDSTSPAGQSQNERKV